MGVVADFLYFDLCEIVERVHAEARGAVAARSCSMHTDLEDLGSSHKFRVIRKIFHYL